MIKILFVCLGNICRSPTAHGIFEQMINDAGLASKIKIDSAGTAAWHTGKSPDPRSCRHALKRGYRLDHLRARQAVSDDFSQYDYILAMDSENLNNLCQLSPDDYSGHLGLMLDFLDQTGNSCRDLPDPYYDGEQGFELVLDLLEESCNNLLQQIKKQLS